MAVAWLRMRVRWWLRPIAALWCGVVWTALVASVVWGAAWASLDVRWSDPGLAVAVAEHWRAGYAIAWAAPGIVAFGALLYLAGLWLVWTRSQVVFSVLTFGLGRILVLAWRLAPFVLCAGFAMWVWEIGVDRIVVEIEQLYALSVVLTQTYVSQWTGFAPERMPYWAWAIVGAIVMWVVSETLTLLVRGFAVYVDRLSVQVALLRRGGVVETMGDDGVRGRRSVLGLGRRMDAWRIRMDVAHERSLREIAQRRAFHEREIEAIEREQSRLGREIGADEETRGRDREVGRSAAEAAEEAEGGETATPGDGDRSRNEEPVRVDRQADDTGGGVEGVPALAEEEEGSFASISGDGDVGGEESSERTSPRGGDGAGAHEAHVKRSTGADGSGAGVGVGASGPNGGARESREDQIAVLLEAFRAADKAEADAEIELQVEEGVYIGTDGPELTAAQREARNAELAAQEAADVAYFAEEAAEFEAGSDVAYSPVVSEPEWAEEVYADALGEAHADSVLKVTLNPDGMPLDDAWGDPLGDRLAALTRDLADDVEERVRVDAPEDFAGDDTVREDDAGEEAHTTRGDPESPDARDTGGVVGGEDSDEVAGRGGVVPGAEERTGGEDVSRSETGVARGVPGDQVFEALRLPPPDWTLRTNPEGVHSLLSWEYHAGDYLFVRGVPGSIKSAASVIERLADGASRYDLSTVKSLDGDAAEPFPSLARLAGLGLLKPGGYQEVVQRLERELVERRESYLKGLSAATQALSNLDNRSARRVAAITQGFLDSAGHGSESDA